jgi:hypothetical protein
MAAEAEVSTVAAVAEGNVDSNHRNQTTETGLMIRRKTHGHK